MKKTAEFDLPNKLRSRALALDIDAMTAKAKASLLRDVANFFEGEPSNGIVDVILTPKPKRKYTRRKKTRGKRK